MGVWKTRLKLLSVERERDLRLKVDYECSFIGLVSTVGKQPEKVTSSNNRIGIAYTGWEHLTTVGRERIIIDTIIGVRGDEIQ